MKLSKKTEKGIMYVVGALALGWVGKKILARWKKKTPANTSTSNSGTAQ